MTVSERLRFVDGNVYVGKFPSLVNRELFFCDVQTGDRLLMVFFDIVPGGMIGSKICPKPEDDPEWDLYSAWMLNLSQRQFSSFRSMHGYQIYRIRVEENVFIILEFLFSERFKVSFFHKNPRIYPNSKPKRVKVWPATVDKSTIIEKTLHTGIPLSKRERTIPISLPNQPIPDFKKEWPEFYLPDENLKPKREVRSL